MNKIAKNVWAPINYHNIYDIWKVIVKILLLSGNLIDFTENDINIKVVKTLQELAESEPKGHSKHQRERRTNIS